MMRKKNKQEYKEYTEEEKRKIDQEYNETKNTFGINPDHEPKIQNIVSTIHMELRDIEGNKTEDKLNLDKIAQKCRNCEYKKSRFPALIQRITEPKSTALIFEAGKMVITGTKSIKESENAAIKFVKSIEKISKLQIKIISTQTSNIVANSQLTYQVNLVKVNEDANLNGHIAYDRASFPGLIYKMSDPNLAALIFYSGKVVFTGAKNEHQIKKAYVYLINILKKHQTQPEQSRLK